MLQTRKLRAEVARLARQLEELDAERVTITQRLEALEGHAEDAVYDIDAQARRSRNLLQQATKAPLIPEAAATPTTCKACPHARGEHNLDTGKCDVPGCGCPGYKRRS